MVSILSAKARVRAERTTSVLSHSAAVLSVAVRLAITSSSTETIAAYPLPVKLRAVTPVHHSHMQHSNRQNISLSGLSSTSVVQPGTTQLAYQETDQGWPAGLPSAYERCDWRLHPHQFHAPQSYISSDKDRQRLILSRCQSACITLMDIGCAYSTERAGRRPGLSRCWRIRL